MSLSSVAAQPKRQARESGPRQKLTTDYLAKQLPVFQERVPKSVQAPLKYPSNAPANLPTPPLLPGEEVLLLQHRVVCTEVFQEAAVGTIYITNYRIVFNGNSIKDPDSIEALLEAQYAPKKNSLHSLETAGTLMRLSSRPKVSNEPSFSSYLTNPESSTGTSAGSTGAAAQVSKFLNYSKRKLGSMRRNRRPSDSVLSDPTSPPPDEPHLRRKGAEAVDGGGDREKRQGVIYRYSQDGVSNDSISVSSQSEFSECHTADERGFTSPPPEMDSGAFYSGPTEYFLPSKSTHSPSVPIPDAHPHPHPHSHSQALGEGSTYVTVDSGINMAVSVEDGPWLEPDDDGVFSSSACDSTHEQISTGTMGKEGASSQNHISLVPHNDEPDFEKTIDPYEVDSGLKARRKLAESGEWYKRSGSCVALDSDSDSDAGEKEEGEGDPRDTTLKAAESLPGSLGSDEEAVQTTSYSKIEILQPVEKKPQSELKSHSASMLLPSASRQKEKAFSRSLPNQDQLHHRN